MKEVRGITKNNKWFEKEGLEEVKGWAGEGLTNIEIYKRIGINEATFYKWKKRDKNFSDALKNGKHSYDGKLKIRNSNDKWLEEKWLLQVKEWASEGHLNIGIYTMMGIAKSTFYLWMNEHPEFKEAVEEGKAQADNEVQLNIKKMGIGFTVAEHKSFKCKEVYYDEKNRRCEKETVVTIPVETFIPPNIVAALAWMNNRQPDYWRRNAGKEDLDKEKFELDKQKAEDSF